MGSMFGIFIFRCLWYISVMKNFEELTKNMINDPKILRMKQYTQHGRVNTYEHSLDVAKTCLRLSRGLHLKVREEELVRGAMLHDYFLYDWHHHDGKWHGLTHPEEAVRNAKRDFDLTETEADIIKCHMWPLTLRSVPRSREAVLVCISDKICSLKETLLKR